jgi:carotenoid cleavage dioxygenase-like enzyme
MSKFSHEKCTLQSVAMHDIHTTQNYTLYFFFPLTVNRPIERICIEKERALRH